MNLEGHCRICFCCCCLYVYDFIFQIHDLPKPSYFHQSIFDLGIGSYEDIEVARYDTPIIEALNKFVKKRVSALPIVDEEGKLLDIYAKFDVIVRTKTNLKTYSMVIGVVEFFKRGVKNLRA